MKRLHREPVLDFSIAGDELEQDRIQLENNLQNTEISFRLSTVTDDEEDGVVQYNMTSNASLEYPRHLSEPEPFHDFGSFDMRSRDNFDPSQPHAWSYRSGDDEEGINPYGGGTLSTAAHHASALTLSAGLGGGRNARRDVSLSGAEYDPERPLHDMIAGVSSKLSVFDSDPSRSKFTGAGSIMFDPLVVDDTEELDRVLESGHTAPPALQRSVRLRSPHSSSTSTASSDSESVDAHNTSTRPKLSDALRRVSFSPKRPRSTRPASPAPPDPPQQTHGKPPRQPAFPASPLSRRPSQATDTANVPTPRPSRRQPTHASSSHPEVRLHPPTPSTGASKFSKMARGLAKDIEHEVAHQNARLAAASASQAERNPFHEPEHRPIRSARQPTPRKPSLKQPRGKVHLPDVTGLTSAVESPMKFNAEYYGYRGDGGTRESEARVVRTLNAVQTKLEHLEEENSISRRRVRELELELEVCKREVARERTRVLEREEAILQHQRDLNNARRSKGKARAKDTTFDGELVDRYKEAVEEKKALEALITTLRTHLTRLTAELSSHQELLTELRRLRESDVRSLKEKSGEVDRLKEQVERLAGEVEVLRGVVEEGLKERRSIREDAPVMEQSNADIAMSQDMEADEVEEHGEAADLTAQASVHADDSHGEATDNEVDDRPELFDPAAITASSRPVAGNPTTRTSGLGLPANHQLVDNELLERIASEVEERRSNRSASMLSHSQSRSRARSRSESRSPSPTPTRQRRPSNDGLLVMDRDPPRAVSPIDLSIRPPQREARARRRQPEQQHQQQQQPRQPEEPHRRAAHPIHPAAPAPAPAPTARPTAPTPNHARPTVPETPFPQIRGEHLERLFFSAPEHNANTCTVCHRHRRPSSLLPGKPINGSAAGLPSRREREYRAALQVVGDHAHEEDGTGVDDDEGFAEEVEEAEQHQQQQQQQHRAPTATAMGSHGQRVEPIPEGWGDAARRAGLPPQTVVARVIRELEDDFTHYKSIYVELADQYKDMDPVSDVPRRNILAQHLREVVDILEQKGDQIASLYGLLEFKDKPAVASTRPPGAYSQPQSQPLRGGLAKSSVHPPAGPAGEAAAAVQTQRHPAFAS